MSTRSKGIVSAGKRFQVLERDMFTCQYCGAKAPFVNLEIDHIVPVSKGGDNDLGNLITACEKCNQGKYNNEIDKATAKSLQREMIKRHVSNLFNVIIESDDEWSEIVSMCLDRYGYVETAKAFTKSARKYDAIYVEEIDKAIAYAFRLLEEGVL